MGCCNSNNSNAEENDAKAEIKEVDPLENYVIEKTLGKGASCRVVAAKDKRDENKKVAIKIMPKDKEFSQILYDHEVSILSKLNHPNIVKLIDNKEDSLHFYIFTQLLEGGELFDRIVNPSFAITEKMAAKLIRDILSALQQCHQKNIVHRDLKPENFVFESTSPDANVVLIDFGCAKVVEDEKEYKDLVGTVYYLAPELAANSTKVPCTGKILKAADVWSMGVITYVMLTGRPPFKGRTNKEIFTNIIKQPLQFPDDIQLSDGFKDFVTKALIKNPYKRISLEDAIRHPWVQGLDAKDIKLNKDAIRFLRQFNHQSKLKKAVTRCLARNMSTEPEAEIRRHFNRLDKDGDSLLDVEELQQLLLDMGYAPSSAKDEAKKILEAGDDNKDGRIDFEEFKQIWHRKLLTSNEQYIHHVFAVFDDNGDGQIDAQELQGTLDEDFQTVTDMIKEVDGNGDNTISFEEFKKAMLEDMENGTKIDQIVPGAAKVSEHDRVRTEIALDDKLDNLNLSDKTTE